MYGFPAHWYFSSCNLKLVGQYKASGRMTEQTGPMICRPESKWYDPECPPSLGLEHGDVSPVHSASEPCSPSLLLQGQKGPSLISSAHESGFLQVAGLFPTQREHVFSAHTAGPHVPLSAAA